MGWGEKLGGVEQQRAPRAVRILGWVVGGVVIAALAALLLGFITKWLWNWLMPDLFGLGAITYWQAVGLMLLARLIIGGGPPHDNPHKHHGVHGRAVPWRREVTPAAVQPAEDGAERGS